ncbi:hypothetical protein BIWAKO_00305 [Bosea sp. BIWAKO-01]|nr:hypothetical protein BIWAKO_00305 [Bosea sp. BIWAKO-01]
MPHHAHAGPCNACQELQWFNIGTAFRRGKAILCRVGMKKPGNAGL